jgi:hypothetical protein
MINIVTAARAILANAVHCAFWTALLLGLPITDARAQQSPIIIHPRDGSTPLGMAPGAPAGLSNPIIYVAVPSRERAV